MTFSFENARFVNDGHHGIFEGHLYTLLTPTHPFPTSIPRKDQNSVDPGVPFVRELANLHWISNETPYTCLIPQPGHRWDPIFERLNINLNSPPIVLESGRWLLPEEVRDDWRLLEILLNAFSIAMMGLSFTFTTLTPDGFRLWRRPGLHYIGSSYSKRKELASRVILAREAFFPWIAGLSYFYLAIVQEEMRHHAMNQAWDWREAVVKKAGFHYQWLDHIEESIVADPSIP